MTTPQTTPELLPCPFCGSTDTYAMDMGGWESFCKTCGTNGPALNTERDKVITDWNTRAATQTAKAAPVEGVRKKQSAAQQLSNIAYNWAQQEGKTLDARDCALLKELAALFDFENRRAPVSPQPLAPPPGWKLVPVKPTVEMTRAAARWLTNLQVMRPIDKTNAINDAYRAMVTASQGATK